MNFDAQRARNLKEREFLTVQHCPGLRLLAGKGGRTWTYRYKSPVDGRTRQVRLGAWPALSLKEAISAWSSARAQRDEGVDLAVVRKASRKDVPGKSATQAAHVQLTVRSLVNDYVEHSLRGNRKDRGTNEIQRMFDTMLDAIAHRAAAEITRSDAYALIESHRHIPVQAAKLKAELRAAWAYGLDSGKLPPATANWWGEVFNKKLRSRGKKIEGEHIGPIKRCLGGEELARLILWLPNFSRAVCDVLTLYIWTMTRGAEICSMEAHEITTERDGMWWTLPKAKTKNARHELATDMRVPLVGRARLVVERLLEQHPTGHLFPSTGESGHLEQKAVQTAVNFHQPYSPTRPKQRRPRLTVTHWAPHDLRRTSYSLLRGMDCPQDVGEVMLGHMLGVYNRHKYDPQQRVWATALDERLEALVRQYRGDAAASVPGNQGEK